MSGGNFYCRDCGATVRNTAYQQNLHVIRQQYSDQTALLYEASQRCWGCFTGFQAVKREGLK